MRVYTRESERIGAVKRLLKRRAPRFGVNKKREISRLLYEISKRDNLKPHEIAGEKTVWDYRRLKKELLALRFPETFQEDTSLRAYLPQVRVNARGRADIKKTSFSPRSICVEEAARSCALAARFKRAFPKAQFTFVKNIRTSFQGRSGGSVASYNRRRDLVFITKENYDFFKRCPCTKKARGCGYHILNLGFGCIFECTYCYLQSYTNSPGIVFGSNLEAFFDALRRLPQVSLRLGTGEFSDSLMLDDVTQYSLDLIAHLRRYPKVTFEFKTKSHRVKNILKARHGGNIVVSWSLNPQSVIEENEFFSASLDERLSAAQRCAQAGYRVGFHFDPVFYFPGWQAAYRGVLEHLFEKVSCQDVAWISIGTFRFAPPLKQTIEVRFPENRILDAELLPGFDGKLRYPRKVRLEIYKHLIAQMHKISKKLPVYLCMEDVSIWRACGLKMPFGAASMNG